MMSDLTWKTSWESVIFYDDLLLPNKYRLKMFFDVATDDSDEQNIAFDRLKFFVENVMQDGIFCSVDDPKISFYMNNFKQKIVTFVQQPQDLTVVSHIFSKFDQISEGRLDIHRLELTSRLGDELTVNFDRDFFQDSVMLVSNDAIKQSGKSPWWFRADCGSADFFHSDTETDKLTFVTDVSSWDEIELGWGNKKGQTDDVEQVWIPTIIPGGKTQH
jgi:hypothetical protein